MTSNELPEEARIEHGGRVFSLTGVDPRQWKITDDSGRNYGTIIIVNAEGEGGEPVYGGVLPAETHTEFEGSDWDAITRGIINQVDAV
jgi:hypothetical protein